jgi:uncharacterized protein YjbI with pentapeptide repeats
LWTWTGFGDKTLWEWLELLGTLAIPVVVVLVGAWFSFEQNKTQQEIENRRAENAQKIEEQRAQDAALQAYLDQMSQLMLNKDLLNSKKDSEVRTLARARTLTVLGRLSGTEQLVGLISSDRKASVVEFLYEASLISGDSPVIALNEANLSSVNLNKSTLWGANLSHANLNGANLASADLSDANLNGANLTSADLSDANLSGANLSCFDPNEAKQNSTNPSCADPNEVTNLQRAKLREANLERADLRGADICGADLRNAALYEEEVDVAPVRGEPPEVTIGTTAADLTDADLTGAKLAGASVTKKQLAQAKSLKSATMPNGQKYEEWRKSRGRGEDGENSGPS